MKIKQEKRIRRHTRVRARVKGTSDRPRLSVYRSNKDLYAQLIDDDAGKTLVHGRASEVEGKTPLEKARILGMRVADRAKEKKIKAVVFDRGGFLFTGRVRALAEGAREGGLNF